MQVAEVKTSSSASPNIQAKREPFFSKDGEGSFFSKSNEGTSSFFSPATIQPKLTIGQPNDKYEVEADAMADKVVQKLSSDDATGNSPINISQEDAYPVTKNVSLVQTKCETCEKEEEVQKKEEVVEDAPDVQEKPIFEREAEHPQAEVQTKLINDILPTEVSKIATFSDVAQTSAVVQSKCEECEQEEAEEVNEYQELQRREGISDSGNPQEDEENVQTKSEGSRTEAAPDLQSRLNASKGKGSPLSSEANSAMGYAFGADFSGVRVHTGSEAAQMSQDMGAQAFTHGSDIYFNEGKYNTNSKSGKHLLAHELTHTIQQGASVHQVRTKLSVNNRTSTTVIQKLAPLAVPAGILARYLIGKGVRWGIRKLYHDDSKPLETVFDQVQKKLRQIPVDIRGMSSFRPNSIISDYIQGHSYLLDFLKEQGYPHYIWKEYAKGPKINLKYGNTGVAPGVRIHWNLSSKTYQMNPYQMVLSHKDFDLSEKLKVLGMNVRIDNNIISGDVGVAPMGKFIGHFLRSTVGDVPSAFAFNPKLFDEVLLGDDNKTATPVVKYGILAGGYIDMMYSGFVDIGNLHHIMAFYHFSDQQEKNEWDAHSDLNVMGLKPTKFNILRTAKGILSGTMDEGEKIIFDASVTAKGFEADSKVKATYLNQTLQISGTGSFKTDRASGDLFFVVTDYATAKRLAKQYLPKEIAAQPEKDLPPPNPTEKLAFMATGNLNFTLFDGNKETRKRKLNKKTKFIGEEPEEKTNKALQADVSFVAEPEGYITIAGQVKPKQETFNLFEEKEYKETIPIWSATVARIPGPLGTSANFNFKINLTYGASIGPLSLSEIKAEGFYSNRPGSLNELSLSGLVKLLGKLYVGLEFCVEVEGELLGLFDVSLITACIEAQAGVTGAVQARPTIQIVPPKQDSIDTSPEYFIRGNFYFDSAGKIFLNINDSLGINLKKKTEKEDDSGTPEDYKYKNSKEVAEKKFGSRDVEIPMDHTLGSQEIPRVSFPKFAKERMGSLLSKLITSGRPRNPSNADKYFEKGTASKSEKQQEKETVFDSKGFQEGREEKGVEETTTTPSGDREAHYVFSSSLAMYGTPHTIQLVVTQTERGGVFDVSTKIMMRSELEELSEKIDEEEKEIGTSDDVENTMQKSDLTSIENQANQVKQDAKTLGINNELSNKSQFPGLEATTISIQNYGNRYKRTDLGVDDTTLEPVCPKPTDIDKGDEIFFPKYTGGDNVGFVLDILIYTSKDKKKSFWHIQYKPKSGRKATSLAPRAYDDDCNPSYIIPKKDKSCENVKLEHGEKIVPSRIVHGTQYAKREKSDWVKAYPLCWGIERKPKGSLVGMDRLTKKEHSKWSRVHLVHAKMGGKGAFWNLVPAPQLVNSGKMRPQFETKLIKLVLDGFKNGKQYWFKAKVIYHKNSDNKAIGHYEDFVKQIQIFYGEAFDLGDGKWKFMDEGAIKTVIDLNNVPSSHQLKPNRRDG